MYSVTYFDKEEYQRHPLFRDRDARVIYGWETQKEAYATLLYLYQGQVCDSSTLPYEVFNLSAELREAELHA